MTAPTRRPHSLDAPDALAAAIDRCLPQTQCAKCDYPNCMAYARAVAADEADINQCPPGGAVSIEAMARLLGRAPKPLNRAHENEPLRLAFIDEADCIGCTLCIAACPVDCIVGAVKLMHTVIADECTGCALCLPVCPTDCIEMIVPSARSQAQPTSAWPQFSQAQVDKARRRAQQKRRRAVEQQTARARRKLDRRRDALKREINAAIERKRASVGNEWQE
ncbi:MAG: RnfABCDGE type electron transport complex subunit B [bacterium]